MPENVVKNTGLQICDEGGRRVVTINAPHFDMGRYVTEQESFETTYSRELLELIYRKKGITYFKDEISRAEQPAYILEPLREAIIPIVSLEGKGVLDYGSGGGASTVNLCRIGARKVHCVEIEEDLVTMTELRARDCGFAEAVTVHLVEDTRNLPFRSGLLDVVVCNAVIEHIPPSTRHAHLSEIWRVLRPGGHLFILETPNRAWPKEGHTTGLPFLPYMPLKLARRYAIAFSKTVSPNESIDDLLARGIRGATYWEIRRALDGAVYVPNNDIDRYLSTSSGGQSVAKRRLKTWAMGVYRLLDVTLFRIVRAPAAAFLPHLSLCFRKPERQ